MNLKVCTVNTEYIEYLRNDERLSNVFENKESNNLSIRKYIGVVFEINRYQYFAPLSSPKSTDYKIVNGEQQIRRSTIPIIRIIIPDENNLPELKGTIKLSNMIPVPNSEIFSYDVTEEPRRNYQILVEKEIEFISNKENLILRNASLLYRQKTCEHNIYTGDIHKPGYLSATVDFKYAEQMHDKYIQEYSAS